MRARTIDIQRKEEEASAFTKRALELGEKSVAFNQERKREKERGVRNDTGEVDGRPQRNDNEARGDITRCVHRVTI